MSRKLRRFLTFSLLAGILSGLVGCSLLQPAREQETPSAVESEPVSGEAQSISVEGRLVPKDWVSLAFTVGGQLEEVMVEEGDLVKKGDVIARLGGKEQLQSAIAAAEFELFSAQQARQLLDDNLDEQQNQALLALNQARQAVDDNERRVLNLGGVPDQTDVDIANTQVVFARNALKKAEDNYRPYANKPEDDLVRARLQIELSNAQKDYDAAVRNYNALTGTASNFELNQAQTDLQIAQVQLALAQESYDTLQKGADPQQVAAAEARILAAESRLVAAKADLVKLDLVATLDGKVVLLALKVGQAVSPGVPVVELADFSEWNVQTENLTEIEVVEVSLGQKVMVIPDALPDQKLSGEVIGISDTYAEKRGEITYTVRIRLSEVDPLLRWGMTVVVEFQ